MHARRQVHLIVGGQYHDFDFVRLTLLTLLAESPGIRTNCTDGYHVTSGLAPEDFLITYTNNVIPDAEELDALSRFIRGGGRWLAIHGSAALTRFRPPPIEIGAIKLPGLTDTPDLAPQFMDLIGCRFVSHLAPQRITIRPCGDHPVIQGIEPFDVVDEPYILELRGDCEVLLQSRYTGDAPGYVQGPWVEDLPRPQLVRHREGSGEVLYLAPGHACGRFDLQPFVDEVPVQRGPWMSETYRRLIRQAIGWGSRS